MSHNTQSGEPSRGDWIRFHDHGGLVIAQVEYVRRKDAWPNNLVAHTDRGPIDVSRILELRPSPPEAPHV